MNHTSYRRIKPKYSLRALLVLPAILIVILWLVFDCLNSTERLARMRLRASGAEIKDWGLAKAWNTKPSVQRLEVFIRDVNPDAIRHLQYLNDVFDLRLRGPFLNDEGLRQISQLPNLRHLSINTGPGSAITVAGMKWIGEVPLLQSLRLCSPTISDAGTKHLSKLRDLQFLSLAGTPVTDGCVINICKLKSLLILDLSYSGVTGTSLATLSNLPDLRILNLEGTSVADAGLKNLFSCKQLNTLRLDGTQISDDGLVHLYGVVELHDVSLTGTAVTSDGIRDLRERFPGLRIRY